MLLWPWPTPCYALLVLNLPRTEGSPIGCSLPPQQGQAWSSTLSLICSRGRCAADFAVRLVPSRARPWLAEALLPSAQDRRLSPRIRAATGPRRAARPAGQTGYAAAWRSRSISARASLRLARSVASERTIRRNLSTSSGKAARSTFMSMKSTLTRALPHGPHGC